MFATPSSQLATLSDTLGRFATRYQPYREAPATHFAIDGGIHAGCASAFKQDRVRVGSGATCDLVLVDPEICDAHAEIAFVHSILGPLASVRAMNNPVTVNGQIVDRGQSTHHLRLPVRIDFDNAVSVDVSAGKRKPNTRLGRAERVLKRLLIICLTLLAVALGLVLMDASDGRNFSIVPQQTVAQSSDRARTSTVTLEDLVARLDGAKLSNKVQVRENADGLFEVSGHLTAAQWRAWQDISVWYDSASFGRPLVTSLSVGTKFDNPPPISMLQVSDPKRVFLANGDVLTIDDVFSGDWIISKIEPDFIQVRRGNEREFITFAGAEN
ncbi:MAG: hypothetical protein QNJ44_22835 [Rhodobacter sp.]|nr:hypothetical protein [Rhodobacter sp.]